MSSEFWAAIVGAIVGGLMSLVLQLFALSAARNDRESERLESKRALARALLFKTIRIHSNFVGYSRHLVEADDRAKASNLPVGWQSLLPLANAPDRVTYSSDEMSMLLSLKSDNVFNDVLNLDVIHNSTIEIFQTYNQLRLELTSRLPAQMDGQVGTTLLNSQQAMILGPRMASLSHLVEAIRVRTGADAVESLATLNRLAATLNEKLGLKLSVEPIVTTPPAPAPGL